MPTEVVINKVSNEADKIKFIKFPWKIYKGNSNWVPPLIFDVKNNLDTKKNPFYTHSKIELFLAYVDGELCGRIGAITNDNHNKFHEDKVGFFGFFECINNKDVSRALFEAASEFLKSEGKDIMRGPVNPSTNDEVGILVDGFNMPPVILTTYNPEYYNALLEDYGFKKAMNLFAYQLTDALINDKLRMDKLERVSQMVLKRENLKIRKINLKDFDKEVSILHEIYNKAWEKNWGFVPMTREEFFHVGKMLKAIVDTDLVYIAESEGKPVAFSLTFPDFNEVFIKMNGRLFPFGVIKFLLNKKKIKGIRVFAMGIIREFQKKGIEAVFIRDTILEAIGKGYQKADISWVLEDNMPMVQTAVNLGAKCYKTYRIYDKPIL
jgi:GNAT superfamily N-acetyltransferase